MNYEEIEKFGSLQFTEEQVSIIVGTDITKTEKAMLAYQRGKLKAEAEVRQSILTVAKNGDVAAMKLYRELCNHELESIDL